MFERNDELTTGESRAHFFDAVDFNRIPEMVKNTILFEHGLYGCIGTDLSPADALDAIRRVDLSSFDWVPRDEKGMRDFLSRYAPPSVLYLMFRLAKPDFDECMDAWKPGSPWAALFETLVSRALVGAVKAYETIIAEESGCCVPPEPVKRTRKTRGSASTRRATNERGSAASGCKRVKTIH